MRSFFLNSTKSINENCLIFQKFEVELNGHEPILEKVISNGDQLIRARHFAAPDIKNKCEDMKKAWAELLGHSKYRKSKLDFSVQKQGVGICILLLK